MSISGMFAPFFGGGAEFSSFNLAKWLLKQGHEVGVLTTAPTPQDVMDGELYEGLRMWRVYMPRPYSIHQRGKAWQKPIWHLQDHFDPANRKIAARVFDTFKPDFINIHILQGVGLNIIEEVAARNIPALYWQHDLGLVCLKRSMFANGQNCSQQCALCKVSCRYQQNLVSKMGRITICSPSQANLDRIGRYFPLSSFHTRATLNANVYPMPTVSRTDSGGVLRLLYVGRLDVTKGIDLLLDACEALADKHRFSLTIVGGGPDEEKLRARAKPFSWCHFTGLVPQSEVSNYMAQSDLLVIPSIWPENSPGVVIHALTMGLPVLGSDKGGIPELVEHDKNGLLVPPGDAPKWKNALQHILETPNDLAKWRTYATDNAHKFSQESLAQKIYAIITETMERPLP
ncbi:MAG: glycosyltransferase family 4 protein [Bdellovibrionales bacterium]